MSDVLAAIREKYPQYAKVSDDKLTEAIGTKYPQYLKQSPDFAKEFQNTARNQLEAGRKVKPATTLGQLLPSIFEPSDEQVEKGNEFQRTKVPEQIDLDEGPNLSKPSAEDINTLTGLKGRTAANIATAAGVPVGAAESVITSGMVGAPPKVAAQLGSAFLGQMAAEVPAQLSQAAGHYYAGDTQSGDSALIGGLSNAAMLGLIAKGVQSKGGESNASKVTSPKSVPKPGVRSPVGEEAPLRQQGKATGAQEEAGKTEAPPARKLVNSPFTIEQGEDGKFHVINPANEVESSHDSLQAAKEAVQLLGRRGSKPKTPEEEAHSAAAEVGYQFRPSNQVGGASLDGLDPEMRAKLLDGRGPDWEFTHPKTGITTYMPSGSTRAQIVEHLKQKDKVFSGQAASGVLPPHHQAILDTAKSSVAHEVELTSADDPNNPFAKGRRNEGHIATIDRKTGKILVNGPVFSRFMDGLRPEDREMAARSVLSQEQNHLATSDSAAEAYWKNLTAAEKAITKKIYSGGEKLDGMNDTLWGHEALSYRLNQLAKMTPHELLETAGKEKWKLKGLMLLETTIRGIRETLGTKASKESLAILGKVQENINLAKAAAAGGTPGAMSRNAQKYALQQADEVDEEAKKFEAAGDKAGAEEMRAAAAELRQKTFDDSFRPGARRRKESKDQMQMTDLLAGDKFAGMKLAAAGNERAIQQADKENFNRAQAESGQPPTPGARPKKRNESVFQDKFLLPGSESAKVAGTTKAVDYSGGETPAVPETERATAEASGALPRLSGTQIQSKASDYVSEALRKAAAGELEGTKKTSVPKLDSEGNVEMELFRKRGGREYDDQGKPIMAKRAKKVEIEQAVKSMPSFNKFSEEMAGIDPSITPGQLHELWYQAVANHLTKASGEELGNLVRAVWGGKASDKDFINAAVPGGKKAFFKNIISGAQQIPDLPSTGQFKLGQDVPGRTPAERYQDERKVANLARSRDKVIGALFNKLAKTSMPDVDFSDKTTEPEDLRYGGGKLISAVQDFDSNAERNPERLGEQLVDEARRSADDPLTATKRLTAIMDRKSGTVDLVSTYRHPSNGTMLVDPNSPNRTHSPLDSILRRYRVIQSVLRDHPVQNFKQHYGSLEEYNDKFGTEAKDRYNAETSFDPQTISEEQFMQEAGGRIERGSGGSFMGPGKGSVVDEGTALEKSANTPMQPAEAEAMLDHIFSEQGTIDSADDVREAMLALKEGKRANQAISGFSKLAKAIQASNPDLSLGELLSKTAQRIYENHKEAENLEGFVKSTLAEAGSKAGQAARTEAAPEPRGEITIPVTGRKPSDLSRSTTAGGQKVGEQSVPSGHGILSDADKAFVGKMASRHARIRKETGGGQTAIFSPGARTRIRQALGDERENIKGEFTKMVMGAAQAIVADPTKDRMTYGLDAADTLANNEARNAEQSVRLESATKKNFHGNKDILSAANAYLATGAVKARYAYGEEAMAEAERLMQEDEQIKPMADAARSMQKSDVPGLKLQAEAGNLKLHQAIQKKLIETGFLNHSEANYTHDEAAKDKLDEFLFRVKQGNEAADRRAKGGNAWDKFVAYRWKKGNQKLIDELEFAKAHWENPELRATAERMRKEMDSQYDLERDNGFHLEYDPDYIPGRYDGELVTPNSVLFGGLNVLGRQFRAAKVFPTYYHAAEQGPYVAATRDGAAIVASRVRQGMRSMNKNLWWGSLKGLKDEASGQPVAKLGKMTKGKVGAPSPDYVEFRTPGGDKIYVLRTYEHLVNQLTRPSTIQDWAPTRAALEAGQFLKHTVLMGDFFHLGRVAYYAQSLAGMNFPRFKTGFAAVDFREEDLDRAVKSGIIQQRDADYLHEKVAYRVNGQPALISRAHLARMFQQKGLNVGQIQDAIYKDLVRNLPGFGRYNKFLFDRFTRGHMMNAALREFDRLSKLDPNANSAATVRKISKDLNNYFGSIGRQGWIKSATFQDLARLTFLAPQWLEGLVKKELSVTRGITRPKQAWTGRDVAFRGMSRGLVGMLALTQVLNMMTRGKPTWQNEEKEHKWDAYVGDNVWLSPLAVFNELTADFLRLNETKPKAWDAIQQIGENKLGFYGRAAMVMATGKTGSGQRPSTTMGLLKAAGSELMPSPISFGPMARAAGHALAPKLIAPNPPGKLTQSLYSSAGFKTHRGMDAEQRVKLSAQQFRKAHGINTPEITYTDDPSYSQLRYLVKIGDLNGAKKTLAGLEKTRSEQEIMKAIHTWGRLPFTGSHKAERLWLAGMTDEERAQYHEAVTQRHQETVALEEWYSKQRASSATPSQP